jgi:hypothetical protein
MNPLYFIRCVYQKLRKQRAPLRVVIAEGQPEIIEVGSLYLLGKKQKPWAAVFQCPSGCGARIMLNLLPELHPHWRVTRHWDSTCTLWPSVNRFVGCRSHFWLEKGLIRWVLEQ